MDSFFYIPYYLHLDDINNSLYTISRYTNKYSIIYVDTTTYNRFKTLSKMLAQSDNINIKRLEYYFDNKVVDIYKENYLYGYIQPIKVTNNELFITNLMA